MTYMYEDDLGNLYTEEEARETVMQDMTWDDYEAFFQKIPFSKLFEKMRKMPDFFETFEMEIMEAEEEYFAANYHETDIPEEDA